MALWRLLKSLWGRPGEPRPDGVAAGQTALGGGGVATAEPDGEAVVSADHVERWWSPPADALVEFPTPAAPELSAEVLALDHLLEGFCEREDLRLPSLPKVAERALRLLESETGDARTIARALEDDPVIAAAVLRLASCSLYAGMERVQNLHDAVARLGHRALRMVLFQHSLAAATARGKRRDDRLAAFVWSGSLASACIMRGLAGVTSSDPEEAYLEGLLHDIGNVLVLLEAQEQEALLRSRIDLEAFVWLCQKHHERLGQLIAAAWNLPDGLQALIAEHHQRPTGEGSAGRAIATVALTDMIKCMLGYLPPAAFNLLESRPAQALGLGGSAALGRVLDGLPEQLSELTPSF